MPGSTDERLRRLEVNQRVLIDAVITLGERIDSLGYGIMRLNDEVGIPWSLSEDTLDAMITELLKGT